ncbi:MAG TPA: hypothetical protein VI461_02490, partial [Chitinophagaceae bacterium]|nr:hypothetical protein [Chitinophagaceae bacterium]
MKKLLIFLLASGLFAACNDTNPFARKDKADKSDKEEKNDRDKKGGNDYDNDDDKNTNYTGSNWSKKQRDQLRSKCLDNFSDEPKAKQICSCLLDKVEQKYPDYDDAMSHDNEDEIEEIAEDCEAKAGGNDSDNNE